MLNMAILRSSSFSLSFHQMLPALFRYGVSGAFFVLWGKTRHDDGLTTNMK